MLKKAIRKLFIKMAILSLVVGIFSPLATSVADFADTGTAFIRTNSTQGSYTIYRTSDDHFMGSGTGVTGTYHILDATGYPGIGYKAVFHDTVPGFTPPGDYYFNLTTGSFLSHTGEYYNASSPKETVAVNTNINDGSYVVYRNAGNVPVGFGPSMPGGGTTGSIFMLDSAPFPGIGYTIRFGAVDDYDEPEDISFNLVTGTPKDYTGEYTLEGADILYENVSVSTNINDGSYTIYRTSDNAVQGFGPADPGNGTSTTVHILVAGESSPGIGYKIVFNNVDNFIKPDDVYFNLVDGTPHTYLGEYTFDTSTPYESVTINTNIAYGSYTVYRDSDDAFMGAGPAVPGQGTIGTIFLLPAGVSDPGIGYRIEFNDVSGYTTPLTKHFNLVDGDPFVWTGYYSQNPADGYITVEIVDGSDNPITDGDWELLNCGNSEDPEDCTAVVVNGGAGVVNMPVAVYGPTYFRVEADTVSGYGDPIILSENPQVLNTTESITFTIMYPDAGQEFEVSATIDGIPAEVDFLYCTGTDTANDCSGVYTTELLGPVTINIAAGGDQFLAFEELVGYHVPENQVSFPPEAAQDIDIDGHPGYYYYPIESDELAEEAVIMNYEENLDGQINVEVNGAEGPAEADVTLDKVGLGEIGAQTILNGETGVFTTNVTTDADYLVNCEHEPEPGVIAVQDQIQIFSADFDSVTNDVTVACEYVALDNIAYLNITTNPVRASVTMDVLSATPAGQATPQSETTTVLTAEPLTYELDRIDPNDDRFTLVGDGVIPYVTAELQITCNPAPGGVIAPAPFTIDPANYTVDAETELEGCIYIIAEENEKVTIQIDTINVTDSAIYVDTVEVRPELDDDMVSVEISIMEEHVITFADRSGFITPYSITIPADTYAPGDTGLNYLGYYVELDIVDPNEVDVEVTTRTVGAAIFLEVGADPTHWVVGHVENPGDVLVVQVDNRVNHEFHFEDKNYDTPPYVLTAEPEILGACTVEHEAGDPITELSGVDTIVTHFQQHYVCLADAVDTLPNGIGLVGDYIQSSDGIDDGDAAFFQARTTNSDVSGEIYATLGATDYTNTYNPGPATFTEIFVSDVTNDTSDTASFESPVTYMAEQYAAIPAGYTLSTFPAGNLLNDLESTYYADTTDVTIRLISLDATVLDQPEAGMEVYADLGETNERLELTIDDLGSIEARFDSMDTTSEHLFTCPLIPGFNPPNTIFVPAGAMLPDSDYTFDCVYTPDNSTDAEIQIQTTAEDQANNFDAAITLTVDATSYAIGYTTAVIGEISHMELFVDTASTNSVAYQDIPPYIQPADVDITVLPGTSYTTNPSTNIFTGFYALPEEATINVYTMDETFGPTVSVDGAQVDVVRLSDSFVIHTSTTGMIEDLLVQPGVDYRIDFSDHPTDAYDATLNPTGYTAPASMFLNLGNGDTSNYLGAYVRNGCEVELYRQRTDTSAYVAAEVMIRIDGGAQFSIGTGNPENEFLVTYMIDTAQTDGTYEFDFMPLPAPDNGLTITPSELALPIGNVCPSEEYTILYGDLPGGTADIVVTLLEMDTDNGPVPNTDATLNGGADVQTSDASGVVTFTDVPVDSAINIAFADHIMGTAVFTTPADLDFTANELAQGTTYYYTVFYVPTGEAVTLDIETLAADAPTVNVNGAISIIINGGTPISLGFGTATYLVSNNTALYSYDIDWGPTNPASSYIEPTIDPQPVDLTGVIGGTIVDIDGMYELCPTICAIVDITAYDTTIDPGNILAADISVDGIPVGTGQHSGTYEVGTVISIEFEDLLTHQTPRLYVVGVDQGLSHTIDHTVDLLSANNVIDGVYLPEPDTIGFTVAAADEEGTELNAPFTRDGINGTTPDSFTVLSGDLDDYTISFGALDGFVAPEDVVIISAAIATVPATVTILQDGIPYVPGTVLVEGDSLEITGIYEPKVFITKEVVTETTIVNNNKRVDYEITLTRNSRDTSTSDLTVNVHDTLSDGTPGTLTGTNGGTMTVVPYNSSNTTCYYPSDMTTPLPTCPDIATAAQDVLITEAGAAGSELVITYQLLSNNTGIPPYNTSVFTNTVTTTYDDATATVERTVDADVSVSAPPTGPGPGPTPGGGGGGGIMAVKGDMVVEVEKLVSLDGINYYDASDPENAFALPKNTNVKLYVKVILTNQGKVSATNIEFTQHFDSGDSGMSANEIENLAGDAEQDEQDGTIEIEKIFVGGEAEFTYTTYVRNTGENGELAKEFLVLEDFDTALSVSQDQLDYIGIGDEYPSYLYAGDVRAAVDGEKVRITVQSDKQEANIGDIVNFLITVENLTDSDVTGLVLTHDYDEGALEVLNSFGGRDNGREVQWTRALLRPGEKISFQVQTRVGNGAPVGENVIGVTRALVNEFEGIAPVENSIYIIGGVQLAQAGVLQLAQTGPANALFFLIILVLAYFGFREYKQLRYLAIKKSVLS